MKQRFHLNNGIYAVTESICLIGNNATNLKQNGNFNKTR